MPYKKKKIALVIGAGSVKCAAALGLWKVLQEAGIPVRSGLLPPNTGWPESLGEVSAEKCACAETVREHLRGFLYAPTPPPS